MILKTLKLTNFGVFHGEHIFELEPTSSRSIVLFGGKNGAGKSTVFEAIRLCLYGAYTGRPTSKNEYLDHLNSRIHTNSNMTIQPGFASVSLKFGCADLGEVHSYEITRSWTRHNGHRTPESLELTCDGVPVDDIAAEHWQDFIQDLIPSGISNLFFFDGEKIQQLAEDRTDDHALDQSVKSLLGLDLVGRLQADLNIYLSKISRTNNSNRGTPIEDLELDLSSTVDEIGRLEEQQLDASEKLKHIQGNIEALERQIASEGGGFAKNRGVMTKRQAELEALIDRDERTVREETAELLPFALAPKWCQSLKTQLEAEGEADRIRNGQEIVAQVRSALIEQIRNETVFKGTDSLPDVAKDAVKASFLRVAEETLQVPRPTTTMVHELSASERSRILSWIDLATTKVPLRAKRTGQSLERLYRELHKVQKDLRKIPAEETLKPLLEKLNARHSELRDASREVLELDEQIKGKMLRHSELEREHSKELEKLTTAATKTAKIRLVPRIQHALDEYGQELITKKIHELEEEATACFNRLSRKKDNLRRMQINPATFEVSLLDGKGRELKKARLSAGEKQIYAVSMLWALARTSGRPLPMIVDTPLARLDSDHRALLIREYFPKASHQVIILSTDTEIDEQYFSQLQPHIAYAYHLDYDQVENNSKVTSGYFWRGLNETDKN